MSVITPTNISVDTYEGPLDLLLHLVQKAEVDIFELTLKDVTQQFWELVDIAKENYIDNGSEFLTLASSLLLLKSSRLLPNQPNLENEEEDPLSSARYDILEHLIEYCQFKELAKKLRQRQQGEDRFFTRGVSLPPPLTQIPKKTGLEQLTLFDLAEYLKDSLAKASEQTGTIKDEEWKLPDKIRQISALLKIETTIYLKQLFIPKHSKGELIVTFLALLELMKQGLCVVNQNKQGLYISREPLNDSRN